MCRVNTAPFIEIPQRADAAARARDGEKLAVVGRHGKTRLMLDLADDLDGAILVRVPSGPDQVPHVVLQAARACGANALRVVAEALSRSVAGAVTKLEGFVGGRPLLVDDADALGVRGVDRELSFAMKDSVDIVREFITRCARVIATTTEELARVGRTTVHPLPETRNGHVALWENVAHDVDTLHLAVLRDRIGTTDGILAWDPSEIVADVFEALPSPIAELVEVLAVHGRPILREDAEALGLFDETELETAVQLGVVLLEGGLLRLPKPWYEHAPVVRSRVRAHAVRLRLAEAFASQVLGDQAYIARPMLVLEAHRHFADAGDVERAREYAFFGAAVLLDAARRISLAGREDRRRYAEAAKTYDIVLHLEEKLLAGGDTLGSQLVGYAIHYRHYNRYKAGSESRVETLAGYERALHHWPGNALFRSRMIVALFLDEKYGEARKQIADAFAQVKPHPKREPVLRGRSTDKLLQRDRVEPALLVWNDYHPSEWDSLYERRLFERLKQGFALTRLRDFEHQLVFVDPVHVRFSKTAAGWLAFAVDASGAGTHPAAAYSALLRSLRAECTRLHRTLTHQLGPEERMRKQALLGRVDLAASGLLDLADGTTWIYGRLTQANDGIALLTDTDGSYPVDPAVLADATAESAYRLARVKTGAAGEPIGPVLEIEAPLGQDPAVAFERWRKRIASDG